jgi:hypothetical protein
LQLQGTMQIWDGFIAVVITNGTLKTSSQYTKDKTFLEAQNTWVHILMNKMPVTILAFFWSLGIS